MKIMNAELTPITVLMNNYNHGHLMEDQLRNVLLQIEDIDELILIDDGSTDNSIDILSEFASKSAKVQFILNKENKGIQECNKIGMDNSSNNLIVWVNMDDLVLPGFFKSLREIATKYPNAGLYVTDPVTFKEGEHKFLLNHMNLLEGYYSPKEVISEVCSLRRQLFKNLWLAGHSSAYNLELLRSVGGMTLIKTPQSDWLANYLLAFKYGFAYTAGSYSAFRVSDTSYSGKVRSFNERGLELKKLFTAILTFDQDVIKAFKRSCVHTMFGFNAAYCLVLNKQLWPLLSFRYIGIIIVRPLFVFGSKIKSMYRNFKS